MAVTSPARILVRLSFAGLKAAKSWTRPAVANHPDWIARAEICQRCPLVHVQCGKSYCGRPLLRQLDRHEPTEGCGCPVNAKAKDPAEHCPRNARYDDSTKADDGTCDCTWCVALRAGSAVVR